MVTKYLKIFQKYELLYFMILFIPILLYVQIDINFILIQLTNNYITLILNNFYLLNTYKKIKVYNQMSHYMIIRNGYKKTVKDMYTLSLLISFVYYFTLSTLLLFIYGYKGIHLELILLFILGFIVCIIESLFVFLQFNRKTNIIYIIIPLCINLIFHYLFIL